MKAKLLLTIFILAAVMWSLAVVIAGTQRGFALQPYLDNPFASGGVGIFGGFMIAACGLRVYHNANHKAFLRQLAQQKPRLVATLHDPLESYQMRHREPYFYSKVVGL